MKIAIAALQPTGVDVLFGRGARSKNHPGNREYLMQVYLRKAEYEGASKADKIALKEEVYEWVTSDQNGRFLKRNPEGLWVEVPVKKAKTKISQALRDPPSKEALREFRERHGRGVQMPPSPSPSPSPSPPFTTQAVADRNGSRSPSSTETAGTITAVVSPDEAPKTLVVEGDSFLPLLPDINVPDRSSTQPALSHLPDLTDAESWVTDMDISDTDTGSPAAEFDPQDALDPIQGGWLDSLSDQELVDLSEFSMLLQ